MTPQERAEGVVHAHLARAGEERMSHVGALCRDIEQAIRAVMSDEREACAALAEAFVDAASGCDAVETANSIAERIRARSR